MEVGRLAAVGNGWTLRLSEWIVTRCFVDPAAFGLLIDGGTGDILRIYIEGCFTLEDAAGREQTFGNSNDPTSFAPLLALMGAAVEGVFISRDGDLTISFDERSIRVPPDPQYEAWHLEGLGRLMLFCLPGGGEPSGVWE